MAHLLIVEDNPGDERLLREALRAAGYEGDVAVAHDGEAALVYLTQADRMLRDGLPVMIFLDLNLPRRDGREVLRTVKADRRLSLIPVVIFTTSRSESDVEYCYGAHANCVVSKPYDVERFFAAVKSIKEFWLDRVELPRAVDADGSFLSSPL